MTPWDYTDSISHKKNDLCKDDDPQIMKEYNPFIINRHFSFDIGTVLYANEMNVNYHLDNDMQYTYLLHSIRKKKRYIKWVKRDKDDDVIPMLMEHYNYSISKATSASKILTEEQIQAIRDSKRTGGKV